jgi:hypothetical protein
MKSKLFPTIFVLLFVATISQAQQIISLHSNGAVTFFSNSDGFKNAVTAAADGDTIYLPGGIFPVSNLTINKKLIIFGVGHSPKHTEATGVTQINGDIYLIAGSDYSSISGLYVNGNVFVGSNKTNQEVKNLIIKRCHIKGTLRLTFDSDENYLGSGFYIHENIIGTLNGHMIRHCLIKDNIISRLLYFRDNNLFVNNIIFRTSEYINWGYSGINGSRFENNIFIHLQYTSLETGGFTNCIFYRNAFVNDATFGNTNSASQNLVKQDVNAIFADYDGALGFNYDYDFNLLETFAGKGFGSDGNDIGIFSTDKSFKPSMLPEIPHIKSQNIATSTDENGNLKINIEVEAQKY